LDKYGVHIRKKAEQNKSQAVGKYMQKLNLNLNAEELKGRKFSL
jgi:hypothetical protein